jgi:hypothetical protein
MKLTRVGVDLAKYVFQVHGVDRAECSVLVQSLAGGRRRRHARSQHSRAGSSWPRIACPRLICSDRIIEGHQPRRFSRFSEP